jgi:DNA-binding PadR family transcriptional regulator
MRELSLKISFYKEISYMRKRDLEILSSLEKFKYMIRDQIAALHFFSYALPHISANNVLKRLRKDDNILANTDRSFQQYIYFINPTPMKTDSQKLDHYLMINQGCIDLRKYREKETSLTYKQQLKAAKELEVAGYIVTKVMGVPSKKYFHITDKILEELLLASNPKSEKREDLNIPPNLEPERQKVNPSYDKRETLALTKGTDKPLQKGSSIKKKNKKEQNKDINNYFVNKESVNNDEIINKLISEYLLKGLSKEVCYRVLKEEEANPDLDNFGAYFRTCLENTLYKSQLKHGQIDPYETFEGRLNDSNVQLINW